MAKRGSDASQFEKYYDENEANPGTFSERISAVLRDTAGNALSFSASLTAPWNGASTAAGDFEEVQISFKNIAGGDAFGIQGSTNGVDWTTLTGVNMATNAALTSITADGLYSFPACGLIRRSGAGAGSPTLVTNLLRR